MLIDRNGQIVTNQDVAQFRHLPLVVGPGAPRCRRRAARCADRAARLAGSASWPRCASASGAGTCRLTNGIDVMLPEGHEAVALDRLMQLQQDHALLDRPLAVVDMRLPDRLVLRPTIRRRCRDADAADGEAIDMDGDSPSTERPRGAARTCDPRVPLVATKPT